MMRKIAIKKIRKIYKNYNNKNNNNSNNNNNNCNNYNIWIHQHIIKEIKANNQFIICIHQT